ncbi:MAG TPA: hypothetical protein VEV41_27050, partial [Terriglobales bacterium]|nr:hypothetical protein [Terriglobales bacterium]
PIVANNEEAVQQLERGRRDGEEIHGCDGVAMIANKGLPAPGQSWISGRSLHPAGDASLGCIEAKHEQFAVDAGSPQVGFSATIRKIRSRTSFEILLLPARLLTFEIRLQYKRKPV